MIKVAGFLILTILFLNPTLAPACEEGGPLFLNLVSPAKSKYKKPVTVDWTLNGNDLLVDFKVNLPVLNANADKSKGFPYQFDVVEVFVRVDDPKAKEFSYYEFEVTPHAQIFNVRVDVNSKGEKKFINGVDVGSYAEGSVAKDKKSWSGSFRIPLDRLGWKGDKSFVQGNFFAILDKKPNKTFWSTYLPPQKTAAFHKPEFFQPLFTCP